MPRFGRAGLPTSWAVAVLVVLVLTAGAVPLTGISQRPTHPFSSDSSQLSRANQSSQADGGRPDSTRSAVSRLSLEGTVVLENGTRLSGNFLAPTNPQVEGVVNGVVPESYFDPLSKTVGVVGGDTGWLAIINQTGAMPQSWINFSWTDSYVLAGTFDSATHLSYVASFNFYNSEETLSTVNDSTGSILDQETLGGYVTAITPDTGTNLLFVGGLQGGPPYGLPAAGIWNVSSDRYVGGGITLGGKGVPNDLLYVRSSKQLFLTLPGASMVYAVNYTNPLDAKIAATFHDVSPEGLAFDSENGNVYVVGGGPALEINATTDALQSKNASFPSSQTILYDGGTNSLLVAAQGGTLYDVDPSDWAVEWRVHEAPSLSYGSLDPSTQRLVLGGEPGEVLVVSARNGTRVHEYWIGGLEPTGLAFDPISNQMYVDEEDTLGYQGSITPPTTLISSNGKVSSAPTMPTAPESVFDPASGTMILERYNDLSAVNSTTDRVVFSVPIRSGYIAPGTLVYDQASRQLFMINYTGVLVLNATSLAVEATLPDTAWAMFLAAVPSLNRLYVVPQIGPVQVFDTVDDQLVGNLTIPDASSCDPSSIAFDPANGLLYVGDEICSSVDVFNATSDTLVTAIDGTGTTTVIAYDPMADGMVATDPYSDQAVFVPENNSASPQIIELGSFPEALAYDPSTGQMLVGNMNQGTISILGVGPQIESVRFDPLEATVGLPVSVNVTVALGAPPYTFSYSGLPPGCNSADTSSLVCVPTAAGSFGLTMTVSDSNGSSDSAGATLIVVDLITISSFTVSSPRVATNSSVSFNILAAGGWGPINYTYEGLPPGCESINAPRLTCTANRTGTFVITAVVSDDSGSSSPVNVTLVVLPVYLVTFSEVGLAAGTTWSVDVNGSEGYTSAEDIAFSEVPGNYTYAIGALVAWNASTPSGVFAVQAGQVTIPISFTPRIVSVVFLEQGLPNGSPWTVNLNGSTSTRSSVEISFLTPVMYGPFNVTGPEGWTASTPSGSVAAIASETVMYENFSRSRFPLQIVESGLPSGTLWRVWLQSDGVGSWLDSEGMSANEVLGSGTYNYTAGPVSGFTSTASGTFELFQAMSLSIAYSAIRPQNFSLEFKEVGLSPGTSWGVMVGAALESGVGSVLSLDLPNGTYTFQVNHVAGYTASPTEGSVSLNGSSNSVLIEFSEMTGPPGARGSGASWVGSIGYWAIGGAAVALAAVGVWYLRARRSKNV